MPNPNTQSPSHADGPSAPLSPELIKKVADKVYAMLLADLRLEAERQRRSAGWRSSSQSKGGR